MKYKDSKFDELQLLELFFFVDDACLLMRSWVEQHWLTEGVVVKKPNRVPKISESEMLTIIIFYHYSGYKCFEYYYKSLVLNNLKSYFLTAPSYTYFIGLLERVSLHIMILAQLTCQQAEKTGVYYVDSNILPVCHLLRAKQHQVFAGLATKSKSSMGWFLGFKLHLVINLSQFGRLSILYPKTICRYR